MPTRHCPISAPIISRGGSIARVAWVPLNDEDEETAAAYEGVDSRGIPHDATMRPFSPEEADVLRRAYGIEEPHRLYVSDSTEEGILKYDTQPKRCLTCYVNSYRVGYVSVRRPGESWEEAERRMRTTPARAFTGSPYPASHSLEDLDPDVQPLAAQMLRDARAAGFRLNVTATYRTPAGESFRILGQVDRTWDWAHVELPSSSLGFRTIEDAVSRGRACLAESATIPCNFPPHLPARLREVSVQ